MPDAIVSDEEFISLWRDLKSATAVAKHLRLAITNVHRRRRNMEKKYKIALNSSDSRSQLYEHFKTSHKTSARYSLGVEDGPVLVFSDAHFWPGIETTAYLGLLWAIRTLKPKAVICNGDAFDGASISRHPRIGYDSKPTVVQELKACEAFLNEIEEVAKKARHNVKLVWTLGNHDARLENRLAAVAPEFQAVKGFSLTDHFPSWKLAWSCWATEDVIIKHRYKGGVHATHNNAVGGGKSIVTGHLHSLKVTPYSDYNGTRFGVDTGTLAEPDGPQFMDYLEDNPVNWRSGFAVLTFHKGRLMWPELVHRWQDGYVEFRGQVIDVTR